MACPQPLGDKATLPNRCAGRIALRRWRERHSTESERGDRDGGDGSRQGPRAGRSHRRGIPGNSPRRAADWVQGFPAAGAVSAVGRHARTDPEAENVVVAGGHPLDHTDAAHCLVTWTRHGRRRFSLSSARQAERVLRGRGRNFEKSVVFRDTLPSRRRTGLDLAASRTDG